MMANTDDAVQAADDRFVTAAEFALDDTDAGHLHYHLLRLTAVGLTRDDVDELDELARLAFNGSDVAVHVAKIRNRESSTPLARAIAAIVSQRRAGRLSARDRMVGAVLGAYAATHDSRSAEQSSNAMVGAVAGAVAVSTRMFVGSDREQESWADYVRVP